MEPLAGLDRLSALDAIERLKARRDLAADTKDWALYEALHAPDHQSYNGDYGHWTSAAEMIANTAKAMECLTTVHHSHSPEIRFDTATTASGVWAMKGMSFWKQGEEDHWFLAFGHYHETYERRDGVWLFTSRRLQYYHTARSPGAIFPPSIDGAIAPAMPAPAAFQEAQIMTDMPEIDRLLAIEEIKLLKSRRDRAVDSKDWDTYLALHAPDHESHNDGFKSWTSAAEMIANVRALLGDDKVTVHHSHTPDIRIASPTRASGIWGMEDNIYWKQGDKQHWLQGFGFYHETYEKRDGNWLFTSRRLKRTHVHTSPGAITNLTPSKA